VVGVLKRPVTREGGCKGGYGEGKTGSKGVRLKVGGGRTKDKAASVAYQAAKLVLTHVKDATGARANTV